MVEQLICNQQVAGSNPIASSIRKKRLPCARCYGSNISLLDLKKQDACGEVPERPKGADCKSAGEAFGGSNPPLSTTQDARLGVNGINSAKSSRVHAVNGSSEFEGKFYCSL